MKIRLLPPIASVCAVFALALALGCSDSDPEPTEPDPEPSTKPEPAGGSGSGSEPGPATAAGSGAMVANPSTDNLEWESLLTGDWMLPAGVESYVCVRQTITEDIYVSSFEAINPQGTHHTFLSIGPPSGPDGTTVCDFTVNQREAVFGSGVGTSPIHLPEGVAMKVAAGTQVLLNLHLYNVTDADLVGTSGTKFVRVKEGEFEFIAQMRNVRRLDLTIPPMQETTLAGSSMIEADTTLFAILPHLHQLGTHVKVVAESSIDGERVLHDMPYDFENQLYRPFEPIRMAQGDMLRFECTWRNTRDETIYFGDSSLDEMCAVGTYRYPGLVPPGGGD